MVLTLSDRIKLVRMSQPGGKLSRAEFGARLGMSASMIQNMEDETRRKNEAPDVVLRHICDVYHVSYLWLTTGDGPMLEPESPEMMVERLMAGIDAKPRILRIMPNTPALVGEGCTAVSRNENVSDEELMQVMNILHSFGTAEIVQENLMDVVGGVSGSSPAYVFMFIEAMADAAVKGGMSRKQAYRFAAQAVLGSAKLLLETGRHPGELKDMVCSPGGTTIEAVEVLEKHGMRAAVMEAIDACIEKTSRL